MKVLVLDSLAGIWPHSLQLTKVAFQLRSADIQLDYVSCGAAAPAFCTVRESRSHTFDNSQGQKKSTCRDCKFTAQMNSLALTKESDNKSLGVFLSNLVDQEMVSRENLWMKDFPREINSALDREIAGTPVVRYALYESILKFKKKDLEFSDMEYEYFISMLRNTIRFALLGEKYFNNFQNPDALLVYAPQYAMNHAFVDQALARKIKVYFVDGNGNIAERYSSITIWDWKKFKLVRPGLLKWVEGLELNASSSDFERINKHKNQLRDGRSYSVYSSPNSSVKNIKSFFEIDANQKIWTLALSSLDEAFAAQTIGAYPKSKYPGTVFENQYEWVRETIRWVKSEKDISLVIRMHPRDLPNKREKIKSEQASIWEEILAELPKNVVLNHPSDLISLNDLLAVSDALITGWSSAALEAMELGIPAVTYDSGLPTYPASIHLTGKTRSQYFENLEKLKNTKKSSTIQKQADRWHIFAFNRGSIRLTGRLFENVRLEGPKFISKALNALDIYLPYIWRPLEMMVTLRRTPEGKKIQALVKSLADSVYDLPPEVSITNIVKDRKIPK